MSSELERTVDYHERTKHHLGRFARGPGHLDWATQPDPFRRYRGAAELALERISVEELPAYTQAFLRGQIRPQPVNRASISSLFYDSLALSAWKRAGDVTWALRANPSSGNLHPTEGYLVCGPVPALTEIPMVGHYAPRPHALEIRARFAPEVWRELVATLPVDSILVGLTSIHWREAWKYGERAFRYCQLDVGHAIAALRVAAAGLGWQATLLDDLGTGRLGQLLGVLDPQGAEPEHPDCLLVVYPQDRHCASRGLPAAPLGTFLELSWQGRPNLLSPGHVSWSVIDDVAAATTKPTGEGVCDEGPGERAGQSSEAGFTAVDTTRAGSGSPASLRQIVRQRRSAATMDPSGRMALGTFYGMLAATLPRRGVAPFDALPWRPLAHLVLFVHRVEGLAPGLYLLVRDPEDEPALRAALQDIFDWEEPPSCPEGLALFRLRAGDVQAVARQLSCQQHIASDGCFSLGMLARFEEPLQRGGPWFYRRLFWECGMIGQMLYLEAEVNGLRGTGIGCFFDDEVHRLLGLEGSVYQSLYHFTVGRAVEDARLRTLPAYPAG